jgi:hypothetical protein
MTPGTDETETSPDGWLRIDYRVEPGRMSHWIRSPSVVDTRSGRTLFSLFSSWDADAAWVGPGVVKLNLRYYPEGGWTGISVTIDAGRQEGRIDDGEPRPLEGLEKAMEEVFEKKADAMRRKAREEEEAASVPAPFRSSRAAVRSFQVLRFVVIAGVALVAVGAAAYYYHARTAEAPAAGSTDRPRLRAPIPTPTPTPPIKDYSRPENRGR